MAFNGLLYPYFKKYLPVYSIAPSSKQEAVKQLINYAPYPFNKVAKTAFSNIVRNQQFAKQFTYSRYKKFKGGITLWW